MNAKAKKRAAAPRTAASATEPSALTRLAKAAFRGCTAGLSSILLFSLIAASIAYMNADPDALLYPLAFATLALCCMVAGFVTRRSARLAPLPCGSVCALALLVALWLFSICLPASLRADVTTGVRLGVCGGVLVFCLLGALMAANMPRGKRVKRKKRT